jgi:hypothetical protein
MSTIFDAILAGAAKAQLEQAKAEQMNDAEQAESDGWDKADRDYAERKDRALDFPEAA